MDENVSEVPRRAATVARTEILLVVGLCSFVAIGFAVEKMMGLTEPVHLGKPLALLLSGVPGILWLVYFYLQDRVEPEPKTYVAGVYLLGAFVAPVLSQAIVDFYPQAAWNGGPISLERILTAIVPLGLAQELSKYLVVRYSVYLSDEFDEPMDGIIYMTAAGIGFATAQNYQALQGIDNTVFFATGLTNAVVTTLAHGCFAGVLGYALGVARFGSGRPGTVIFVGLCAAAVLNGLFNLLESLVTVSGMHVEPWRGVAFAAIFAAVVFAGTFVLMRRHLAASPHAAETGGGHV